MSDDYTNLDLDTAEELMIAAGQPGMAKALRHQQNGVRNMIQGEWGRAFLGSLDGMLSRHIAPLVSQVEGLRSEVATRLGKLETATRLLKGGQRRITNEVKAQNQRHEAQINEIIQRLDHKRQELDDIHVWQQQVDARAAQYSEDEIRVLVDYVRRKMAEEQAGHGNA